MAQETDEPTSFKCSKYCDNDHLTSIMLKQVTQDSTKSCIINLREAPHYAAQGDTSGRASYGPVWGLYLVSLGRDRWAFAVGMQWGVGQLSGHGSKLACSGILVCFRRASRV